MAQHGLELLTAAEMALADAGAIERGVPERVLMENAGRAVAAEAARLVVPGAAIAVACGPGNNGGDGFVAARLLAEQGFAVRVVRFGAPYRGGSAAAQMAEMWTGPVLPFSLPAVSGAQLLIDAVFGAGLNRPLPADVAALLAAAGAMMPILAVDVPSGVDGTTGAADGLGYTAQCTVTFARRKPGHLLLPGRDVCGQVVVADIGIPDDVIAAVAGPTWANAPALWIESFAWPGSQSHKYRRGHAGVVSGPPSCTGAARLAARGALRAGAGAVTLLTTEAALAINAAHLTAIMLQTFSGPGALSTLLGRPEGRYDAVVIGPGIGRSDEVRDCVLAVLHGTARVVLDADALSAFEARGESAVNPGHLIEAIKRAMARPQIAVVMTPHEGEFRRLFPDLAGSKLDRARAAAAATGAIVVLKGADTVIADASGRAAINSTAPAWLATAGSGDVLAGMIAGLLAQGMPAFEAACAGVWMHGDAAASFGPGLIAEDIPEHLPRTLARLYRYRPVARPGG